MSTRNRLLLASAALLAVSTPALAQEVVYDDGAVVYEHDIAADPDGYDGRYQGGWEGHWVDRDHYEGEWDGTYHAEGHGDARRDPRYLPASPDGRLAYTLAEREAWLSDCRLLMADGGGYYDDDRYYDRRGGNGAVIGGLVGAVTGGVIGNRVADGNRTAGTLIGAGVGGLAGAAVGSALDSDGDGYASRGEIWADRYCDAYLRRYEMGGGSWGYGQQQMMMVMPVAAHGMGGHRHDANCRTIVTEEIVEIEEAAPAPRPRARRTIRRPIREPGKLTPIAGS
ncbi:glycine zipper domain-containing protein [Aurantiacibacter luteus]|uniref:glycine zipper domain-containing protein n=1 Tax=Aurantiacibacter luteus TaxID=1581420 RepID=UPI0006995301|nr:glycine zipper domain-containing protein [Aurantiacibacter luteus]